MLKLTSLALGFIIGMAVVSSSQAATRQDRPTWQQIAGHFHAQKLVPIGTSVKLKTIIPAAPQAPSAKETESQQLGDRNINAEIKSQRERERTERLGSKGFPDPSNPRKANYRPFGF
jgi:hypothetical protein